MGFLGCNIMRVGGSKFYQPFSVGGGVLPLCGFSTYFNGTTAQNIDFVYRAPIRISDNDSVGNTSVSVDWKSIGFDLKLDANVIFSEQAPSDRYIRHESSIDPSTNVSISYISSSSEARFLVSDSGGVAYQFLADLTGLEADSFRFTYNQVANTVQCYVDGVLYDSSSYTPTGNLTVNKHFIGSDEGIMNFSPMLLSSYEATGLGKANFVTNQGDGLSITSDNGAIWLISESVLGSTQIKADGTSSTAYEWPDVSLFHMPTIGVSKFSNDNVIYNIHEVNAPFRIESTFDMSKEWTFSLKDILVSSDTTDDGKLFYIADGSGSLIQMFYDVPNTRFRINISAIGSVTGSRVINMSGIAFDDIKDYTIGSNGGTAATRVLTVTATGKADSVSSFDYTGYTPNTDLDIMIGGFTTGTVDSLTFSGEIGDIDFNSTDSLNSLDKFLMNSRYLGCNDANIGKIVGTKNRYQLTPTNGQEFTYPYYTTATSFDNITPFEIKIIGDSISAGSGEYVQEFESWLTVNGITDVTVSNLAVSGYDSFHGCSDDFNFAAYPNGHAPDSAANITAAIAASPKLIIWFMGQNDNTQNFTLAESEAVLDNVIAKCAAANIPLIIFITMPRDISTPTNVTWADDFAQIQLTKIDNVNVWGVRADILLGLGGSPNYLDATHAPDLIHPDNSGDRLLAEGNNVTRGLNNTVTQIFKALPCVVSDTQCTGSKLVINELTNIAVTNELTGKFVFNEA